MYDHGGSKIRNLVDPIAYGEIVESLELPIQTRILTSLCRAQGKNYLVTRLCSF